MNPEDKYRGKKNYHERKAANSKAHGLPSDHLKGTAIDASSGTSQSVKLPRRDTGGSVQASMSYQLMQDAMNNLLRSSIFTFTIGDGPDVRFSGKEFAASAAKGCRSFKVDELGRLRGVAYDQVWTPGENVSECRATEAHKEPNGFPNCKCGFYGYYDGSNDFYKSGYVSAVVQGWGEAVMGENGFRVKRAKILALTIDSNVLGKLEYLVRRNYDGIPMFETFGEMVRAFQPDYGLNGADEPSPADEDFWTRDA